MQQRHVDDVLPDDVTFTAFRLLRLRQLSDLINIITFVLWSHVWDSKFCIWNEKRIIIKSLLRAKCIRSNMKKFYFLKVFLLYESPNTNIWGVLWMIFYPYSEVLNKWEAVRKDRYQQSKGCNMGQLKILCWYLIIKP